MESKEGDGKVRVRVRLRDRRHDALVGRDVLGQRRSKRLARIQEEEGDDDNEAGADTVKSEVSRGRGSGRVKRETSGADKAEADMDTD